jgi:hypothetical protein
MDNTQQENPIRHYIIADHLSMMHDEEEQKKGIKVIHQWIIKQYYPTHEKVDLSTHKGEG